MADDPQNIQRKMIVDAGTLNGEVVRQVGIGPKLSDTPGTIRSLGVTPGQNTREILGALGYDDSKVSRLIDDGAVDAG